MNPHSLTFDALAEAMPGSKWQARWDRSWPEYRAWFLSHGGQNGPSRAECEAALTRHMPELSPVHRQLSALAGGGDLAARFLSTWRPPAYFGGCSIAAIASHGKVRLVRNYDLAPELNEGLLLRTEWTGTPVMGMIEFLWGVSDGVNGNGLALALAYGGRREAAPGFGVTTILRYVLETCGSVAQALAVLRRIPSHMAYNVTLADRHGATATAELAPGGGARIIRPAIATNHQNGAAPAENPSFTATHLRHALLTRLLRSGIEPDALADEFLKAPLYRASYDEGFGTLFTAICNPVSRSLTLRWPDQAWRQLLPAFVEGRREIRYGPRGAAGASHPQPTGGDPLGVLAGGHALSRPGRRARNGLLEQSHSRGVDWAALGRCFAE